MCDPLRQARKPTKEDIEQSRWQIIFPSQFGNTLAETMDLQRKTFPQARRLRFCALTLALR